MDNAGPDGAISKISLAVVIYRGEKPWGVYSFTGQGVISQKPNDIFQKMLCLALEYIKNCRSGLSLAPLGCSAGQILVQKSTKFDRPRQTVPTR